eukprot:scaffold1560_cov177-Ochromonas_danica.AAC.6
MCPRGKERKEKVRKDLQFFLEKEECFFSKGFLGGPPHPRPRHACHPQPPHDTHDTHTIHSQPTLCTAHCALLCTSLPHSTTGIHHQSCYNL